MTSELHQACVCVHLISQNFCTSTFSHLISALQRPEEAQHACTLCPTFQRDGLRRPTATNANTGLFQVQTYFFPFFTGISKQTETELAVRQLHEAGRAAVSSHDPSLTQSDESCGEDYRGGYKVVPGEIRGARTVTRR